MNFERLKHQIMHFPYDHIFKGIWSGFMGLIDYASEKIKSQNMANLRPIRKAKELNLEQIFLLQQIKRIAEKFEK